MDDIMVLVFVLCFLLPVAYILYSTKRSRKRIVVGWKAATPSRYDRAAAGLARRDGYEDDVYLLENALPDTESSLTIRSGDHVIGRIQNFKPSDLKVEKIHSLDHEAKTYIPGRTETVTATLKPVESKPHHEPKPPEVTPSYGGHSHSHASSHSHSHSHHDYGSSHSHDYGSSHSHDYGSSHDHGSFGGHDH